MQGQVCTTVSTTRRTVRPYDCGINLDLMSSVALQLDSSEGKKLKCQFEVTMISWCFGSSLKVH